MYQEAEPRTVGIYEQGIIDAPRTVGIYEQGIIDARDGLIAERSAYDVKIRECNHAIGILNRILDRASDKQPTTKTPVADEFRALLAAQKEELEQRAQAHRELLERAKAQRAENELQRMGEGLVGVPNCPSGHP